MIERFNKNFQKFRGLRIHLRLKINSPFLEYGSQFRMNTAYIGNKL